MLKVDLVVSRHPALVAYLCEIGIADEKTLIIPHAERHHVQGKVVAGVLPHRLSSLCDVYVELQVFIPYELRGKELSLKQIKNYADDLRYFKVKDVSENYGV